jgi:polyisoprenoid-binding protein YceI
VEFAVRHLMISTVKGRFADVQGTIRGLARVG